MFVTALVSGGVPDIIFVAQLIFKFGDHALIADNRGGGGGGGASSL